MARTLATFSIVIAAAWCVLGAHAQHHKVDRIPVSADVPEWAKEAVWYQIFPERFRNGDLSNDPKLDDIRGSWPHLSPENWAPAEWTADWYARSDWERQAADDFYTSVQLRRYGGDIQGIIDRLDYLDSLGVTAIYLNPVFESPSLHKYDAAFYHHIDKNFGPDPDGDQRLWANENPVDPSTWHWTRADRLFLELIEEVHNRGMRIIIDGVFNHMGLRSFAFEDVQHNREASPFRDWFTITDWGDPDDPNDSFSYEGWMGVKELPELREDDRGLIQPIRDYVFASVRRWMDPNGDGDPSDGIDGWRLDVAEMVNLHFWRDFRDSVRTINPEAYLVGEVWWEEWPDKMFNAAPWLDGTAFDAVMNYRWATAARRLFLGSDRVAGSTYDVRDFAEEVTALLADYPPEINFVLMNTYGSHDTDRLASQVVNRGDRFDYMAGVNDNRDYDVRRPSDDERQLQRLMLAHQFTFIGAPHIFYGDEAGMWGADDPDERKPMLWPDMDFEDEVSHPFDMGRPEDPVSFDHELFDYYRLLAHLRRENLVLSRGGLEFIDAGSAGVLAYERRFGDERAWIVFNLSNEAQQIDLPIDTMLPAAGHTPERSLAGLTIHDALSGARTTLSATGFQSQMPALSARIWIPSSLSP